MTSFDKSASATPVVSLELWRSGSQSVSDWKHRVFGKLRILLEASLPPNDITYLTAEDVLKALPHDIDEPELEVDENGWILFEWFRGNVDKQGTIFSILIRDGSLIVSGHHEGIQKIVATFDMSTDALDLIFQKVREYFGVSPNVNRRIKA